MVLRIKAVLLALGLSFAGCMGTEPSPSAQGATDPTTNPATATAQTATAQTPPVAPETTAATVESVSADLVRLRALDVVEFGELLAVAPSAADNCYVCPPPSDPDVWERKAAGLHTLVAIGEAAAAGPLSGACDTARVDDDLAALAALDLVEVGGLITAIPEQLSNCYCQEEIQAHQCARVDTLAAMVDAAREAFVAPAPTPPTSEQMALAVAAKDDNLDALRALHIVTIGPLILDVPEEAMHCYGVCPGWEDEVAAAEGLAAVRLDGLVKLMVNTAEGPPNAAACEPSAIDANVQALKDLAIVAIGTFVAAEPANNPSCYNLPCADDIALAEAVTCARAEHLARVVDRRGDL